MIAIWERLISIFIYMMPWSDALIYGRSIFSQVPVVKLSIIPTLPILIIKQNLPIGNLLILLLLFLGIVKNRKLSYFIRFNTMQSILLSIILVIFSYLKIFLITITVNSPIIEGLETTIFIFSLTIILFCTIQCLRGIEANIPGISNSAKIQI